MEEKKRKKIIIIVVTVIAALTVLCALGLFLAFVLFGVNSVNSSTHAHIVITPTPTMMPTPVITTPAPTEVPDKTETGDKITVTLKELEVDYFVVTWNKLSDEEVLGYNVYWADKDTETMKYELVASLGAAIYGIIHKKILKKEKLAIAFVPFMLAGYIIALLTGFC